jgi:hypothetical protein
LEPWDDSQVEAVLGLAAALPEAEQARCFIPGYAIRIRDAEGVLAEVAFCFRCRNAKVLWPRATSGAALTWFAFDPDSQPAQQLLRRFRAYGSVPGWSTSSMCTTAPSRTPAASAAYSSALARAAATALRRACARSSRLAATSKPTASISSAPAATTSTSRVSTWSRWPDSTTNAAWHW